MTDLEMKHTHRLKQILLKFGNPEFYSSPDDLIIALKEVIDQDENPKLLSILYEEMLNDPKMRPTEKVLRYFDYEMPSDEVADRFLKRVLAAFCGHLPHDRFPRPPNRQSKS